jgi:hypothetical protein
MIKSWASEAVSAYEAANSSSILANSPSSTASSDSATASLAVISSPYLFTKTGSSYFFSIKRLSSTLICSGAPTVISFLV